MNGKFDTRAEAAAHGEPRYNTGRPCKHGHVTDRYTVTGSCVICAKEANLEARRRSASVKRASWVAKASRADFVFTVGIAAIDAPRFLKSMELLFPGATVTNARAHPTGSVTGGSSFFETPDGRRVYSNAEGRVTHVVHWDGRVELRLYKSVEEVPGDQLLRSSRPPDRDVGPVEATVR